MWQRLFYEWFLNELLERLRAVPVTRASEDTVIAPREGGQVTLDRDGSPRVTGRQSNLIPRPAQRVTILEAPETRALGDGTRRKPHVQPRHGFVPPPGGYPHGAVTPPNPLSVRQWASAGVQRFNGVVVPTVAQVPDTDNYARIPNDPAGLLWRSYAGTVESEAPEFYFDTDPQFIGPNWFWPYSSTLDGAHAFYGLSVPVWYHTQYWNLSDAFLGGSVHTYAPDDSVKPVWHEYIRNAHFAANAGHHFVIPRGHVAEPYVIEGTDTLLSSTTAWPIGLSRGAVYDQLALGRERLTWPLVGYGASGGDSIVFRYRLTGEAGVDGQSYGVNYMELFRPAAEEPRQTSVPADYGAVTYLAEMPSFVPADGRPSPARVQIDWNVWDINTFSGISTGRQTVATVGPTQLKGLINQVFTYYHGTQSLVTETMFGLVGYAAVSMSVYDRSAGAAKLYDAASFAMGGWIDSITTEPEPNPPPATAYDPDDPRRRSLEWMRQSLRVLRIPSNLSEEQVRIWWSQRETTQRQREDSSAVGYADSGTPGRLGVEYDWLDTGWVKHTINYRTVTAPSVPTVGRFAHDDYGPEAVEGVGLRMSHQEYYDDFPGGAEVTIGRVMTLVPPSEMRAYFPPVHPDPPEGDFPLGTFSGDDFPSECAAVIGRMVTSGVGSLNVPFAGGVTTFAGISVDAGDTFAADAVLAPDGSVVGVVVTPDGVVRMSVAGAVVEVTSLAEWLGDAALALEGLVPTPHQRMLLPGWPFRVGALRFTGSSSVVFRARVKGDGRGLPAVFMHVGGDGAA